MKMLFKHITLLMFSGVIIPVYLNNCCLKDAPVIGPSKAVVANIPAKHDRAFHFSLINDVVAKLLPAINYFK